MSRGDLNTDRQERRNRRSIRLKGYDYAGAGAYFVTICAQNRECLFGRIEDGQMILNDAGRMVDMVWDQLPIRFPHLELDEFIVMPNHIHGILSSHRRGEPCVRPDCVRPVSPGDQPSGNNDTSGDHNTQTGDHKDRPYMAPDTVGYRKLGGHNTSGEHKVRPTTATPAFVRTGRCPVRWDGLSRRSNPLPHMNIFMASNNTDGGGLTENYGNAIITNTSSATIMN
jgi:hypothetical protein